MRAEDEALRMEKAPDEVASVEKYNSQILANVVQMKNMMEFKPNDMHRILDILYKRIESRFDFRAIPVWIVDNMNQHPGQLNREFRTLLIEKEHHFLTRHNLDLDAENIDAVSDSTHHWVKQGKEDVTDAFGFAWGTKRRYIWKKKPERIIKRQRTGRDQEGSNRTGTGDQEGSKTPKEENWKLTIYTLSDGFNNQPEHRAVGYRVRDPDRIKLWKLVTLSPTQPRKPWPPAPTQNFYVPQPAAVPAIPEAAPIAAEAHAPEPAVIAAAPGLEGAQEPVVEMPLNEIAGSGFEMIHE